MKNGTYEYKLLYSGQLSPIARLDADSRVVEEYVYGSRVNVPEYMIKDGRKYRFITDHRGSVRMVVDTHTGEVVQETEYCEFGMIISETLADGWEPVIFGYAGGLQDRDTGLIRFGARDYDPMVGRWTSKEPLGFNGSSNFYVYAENDPVNYYDFTGLDTYAVGVSFEAGSPLGLYGFSGHIVWDDDGNVGLRFSGKTGAAAVPTASAMIEFEQTNARNIKSLEGLGMSVGGSAGQIAGASADFVMGLGKEKYKGGVCGVGFTAKTPFPFELHGTFEMSKVKSRNIKNDWIIPLKNWVNSVIDSINN
jgi:RHS repeat-associated protein